MYYRFDPRARLAPRATYQSVVKVRRSTETGDAPVWQGTTRENTGSI